MKRTFLSFVLALASASFVYAAPPARLDVKKGDHLVFIGNALADRMQHDSNFEALIHKAFPKGELTVRNLGFAGDAIGGFVADYNKNKDLKNALRNRSEDAGSSDDWLKRTEADVIFAFFGFNESFEGYEGLAEFKADLDKFIKHTQKQNYSGKGAPRVVLFSPIAHEKMADPNLADPQKNNTNLQNYTAAMAEVAAANGVQFVDLFTPSQQLYKAATQPLTFNGIHLTEWGNKALAPVLFKSVFAAEPPTQDAAFEKLRAAVREKNAMWHSRYRTVDNYNIYGDRSKRAYEQGKGLPKMANYVVMHQEMAIRDVMTQNRDKRVWAIAQGGDLRIDDSNAPKPIPVKTNKPGPNPDGSHKFLSGEEAIKQMTTPKGVKVNLFASEEMFPELIKPVHMAWDTKGRLWVAAWPSYPERTPWDKKGDSILILEDTNGDGKADKISHYLDNLNCPTGFQFYKDGILVMQAPDLWFVRDTNGDGKADWRERVLMGLDAADSHHETNSMVLDPGGATYLSDGVFHRTQVETAAGPVRNIDGAIYRYEPRAQRFERYIAFGFANPHGRVFDYWGNDIVTDGTGNNNYFGPAFSSHIDFPAKHPKMEVFWKRPSRPCAATGFLSSRAWPDEFNGNFLNCNVIGNQGIFRVKVTQDGSGLKGETLEDLVMSKDPNFRPCDVNVGPDGAVYFADWSNAIIGHLQHHLRDPNRDNIHGRIYRMTYEGRPLLKPVKIAGEPIEKLLDLLKEPEDNVRDRTKIELGTRDTAQVVAAVDKWVAGLDQANKAYEHHMLNALWVKQYHNVVDPSLLKRMLRSPVPQARAAATRVLCYQRDRVPDALALLKTQAIDESPRVRLEAVRAASFFDGNDVPTAIDVVYSATKLPTDYYLDFTSKETLKQLNSLSKETVLPSDPVALAKAIENMSEAELLKAPNVELVLFARLERKGIDLASREAALKELASLHKTDRETELVAALKRIDGKTGANAVDDLGKLLTMTDAKTLAKVRPDLAGLAEKGTQHGVRRAAFGALIVADGDAQTTWSVAKSEPARASLIAALSLVPDPTLRAKFQPLLTALLADASASSPTRSAALRALPLMGPENAKANFATLATNLTQGAERTAAARAIMQIPRDSWDATAASPLAESILAWAKTVPAGDRTQQDFIETVQAGMEFASLLPSTDADRIRKELRGVGVSVFVVKTVREQMRYDTSRIVVEAGKPFEVIFENVDMMPHNFVIVEPGARQAVAESVQTMKPDDLDDKGRAYVPRNDPRVIDGSKMVEAGEKETLKFTAPAKEGEYEFVCTYPGHWMIMWGKFIVTKDIDAYLQAHPQASATPAAGAGHDAHQHSSTGP